MQQKFKHLEKLMPLFRFLAYQIVWWLLVFSSKIEADTGIYQFSNLVALIVSIASLALILGPDPRGVFHQELTHPRRLVAMAVFGFLIDSLWITRGLIEARPTYGISGIFTLAPPWLFAIWISFAATCLTTVSHDSNRLFRTPRSKILTIAAMALLGAVGGPLSYMVGAPLKVLTFAEPKSTAIALIAFEWSIMFPVVLIAAWFALTQKTKKIRRP